MTGRPKIGALAIVPRGGAVLMVRRGRAPSRGLWGFPGGHVEWGETVGAAALRELAEETGVTAVPGPLLGVLDVIGAGHHYVLTAHLCHWRAGEPVAADDAEAAAWWPVDALPDDLTPNVDRVLGWLRAAQGPK
jgi:ADP-ribose pyrophosphatase YjhB (NUDIX family)